MRINFPDASSEWSMKFGEDEIKLIRIVHTHYQDYEAVELLNMLFNQQTTSVTLTQSHTNCIIIDANKYITKKLTQTTSTNVWGQ